MQITTKFNIWDWVETALWDIWLITAVVVRWIHNPQTKYCVRVTDDKEQRVEDRQIKKKNWSILDT